MQLLEQPRSAAEPARAIAARGRPTVSSVGLLAGRFTNNTTEIGTEQRCRTSSSMVS
ncbi:hypothetical protein [Mycobacterium intracellulare]|uniref:Uncharacterized protein n=1 Tax=Mycobacterium intracellulare subsp. chimaera TaxID=222805 RepID=A0ABT7P818_MYCIT|nr:hypothetical protein [Mycobacterium intracellulare]MCA2311256.1 hypothetical protein [Mycobacterium intracellulare subsp. chimaera]MCA2353795.1 hypothetical protein [Mycobacterium intracellulare subsp. chimaera]MCF1814417.1 hypothetical protein [Mycobacterium intracellulare subsp. intracellulare]MCV7325144.1 hypothetical protein [Mycobacterium intracellulare subsp. chimaera]MDM3929412.1 hypothetical protein [Mycobacterium intracellulare subsp. chimaera]